LISAEKIAAIKAHQASMERAHRMTCSDPSDPARSTSYGDSAAAIEDLLALARELQAQIDALRKKSDSEGKHWEAWDVYANSGNLDNHHAKVFHAYVDGHVSREYMVHTLANGPAPCEHDHDYGHGDPARPACAHCNGAALTAEGAS
jgi:hypothetical protein